ncbi:MAG: sensory box histidine kinase/response regulator [Acidobacteria bacterium]|nr:sensory box histidine kinase/response regulator [Acidobacteriota bacterium]
MQRLVEMLLKRAGFRVDIVSKGLDAIGKLKSTRYDALLLDLMMPHEGGMTVINHLRELDPAALARVILLTATPQSVIRAVATEVFGTVRKPFEAAELIETVTRCVNGTR